MAVAVVAYVLFVLVKSAFVIVPDHLAEAAMLMGGAAQEDATWAPLQRDVDELRTSTADPTFANALDDVRRRCDSGMPDDDFKPLIRRD